MKIIHIRQGGWKDKIEIMMKQAKRILKTVFGYDEFISLQAGIIENVLNNKHSLVVMPTGGGKSLCYQIPALIFDGLTVIVSPLISLMKDQVAQLEQVGISATLLNSSLTPAEYRRNVAHIKAGKVKMLYLAPESLLKENILALLSSLSVSCLAVDEAHCISSWGHDFRPEYRQLTDFKLRFPDTVCIALTATATPRVRKDIKESLEIHKANEFIAGFDRKNLLLRVVPKENPFNQVLRFLEKYHDESGIIYCFSRKQTDDLCSELKTKGVNAAPYHAGMNDDQRTVNQDMFASDDVKIIVATIAFGMGINKSNVRFVIHYDMPQNLESYYQEIGRAGRDGLFSECLLLFSYADIHKIRFLIEKKEGHEKRIAAIHLNSMIQYAETDICRRIPLLDYFGEKYPDHNCGMCDNCLSKKEKKIDVTLAAQKFLSCVKRTGERFGAGHIIDVLLGSKSRRVLELGHDRLSTHGIGREYSRKQWMDLSRSFLNQKILVKDMEYGRLSLTAGSWEVLKNRQNVLASFTENQSPVMPDRPESLINSRPNDHALFEILRKKRTENQSPVMPDRPESLINSMHHDHALFEILRKKRKELADETGVPPYVVFSDRTLTEMATFFPKSKENLLKINGVGEIKAVRYGLILLNIIRQYCGEQGIEEIPKIDSKTSAKTGMKADQKRHRIIGKAFALGRSVNELAAEYNIKRNTVLDHLYQYTREGNRLDPERILNLSDLSPEHRELVIDAFKVHGTNRLRPVFEALNQSVSYDELRIICLYIMNKGLLVHNPKPEESVDESFFRTIVCLANSRKYSGSCIAGKEILQKGIGGWIRPVSNRDTGELTAAECILGDGRAPDLLEIISIPLERACPHAYQVENHLIAHGSWNRLGTMPPDKLADLCDKVDELWINGYHSRGGANDRFPVELATRRIASSLLFIQPDNLCLFVEEGPYGLNKVKAEFYYRGTIYRMTVTDPVVEKKYIAKAGKYPADSKEKAFITVSISEPFEGFCYKLAAGIIQIK